MSLTSALAASTHGARVRPGACANCLAWINLRPFVVTVWGAAFSSQFDFLVSGWRREITVTLEAGALPRAVSGLFWTPVPWRPG